MVAREERDGWARVMGALLPGTSAADQRRLAAAGLDPAARMEAAFKAADTDGEHNASRQSTGEGGHRGGGGGSAPPVVADNPREGLGANHHPFCLVVAFNV